MPLIEELPSTAVGHRTPGFAWVADTGYDASKAAMVPAGKKRARASTAANTAAQRESASAKQQKEVERRIKALNADNTRDVNIPVPKREGQGAGQRLGKTPNSKRILASGKDFGHYLEDDEAELARRRGAPAADRAAEAAQRASKTPLARRKPQRVDCSTESSAAARAGTAVAAPALSRHTSLTIHFKRDQATGTAADAMELDDSGDDNELPALPSQPEIQALLAAPPLSYNEARAGPPPPTAPPPRIFCEICGYWGRVRCMKCGARVCGMECKDAHDAERCLRFHA